MFVVLNNQSRSRDKKNWGWVKAIGNIVERGGTECPKECLGNSDMKISESR